MVDPRTKKRKKKPPPTPPSQLPPVTPSITDAEANEILKKLHEMDTEIQQRMNTICELSGMSKEQVQGFLDNPSNFPPEKWEKMQREKEALEDKIYQTIGIEAKKKRQTIKKKKTEEGRRGKTLGGRKGWIQM